MKKKWIWILALIVVSFLITYFYFYYHANTLKRKAYAHAEVIATEKTSVRDFSDFYQYYGTESYSVLIGSDKDKQKVGVWISNKDDEVKTYLMSEGISGEQAADKVKREKTVKKMLHTTLGMKNGNPIWEVAYINESDNISYYYIDFLK